MPANPGSLSGAGAGIQEYQVVTKALDTGFRRYDVCCKGSYYPSARVPVGKSRVVTKVLDPGFRRGDDLLRVHHP